MTKYLGLQRRQRDGSKLKTWSLVLPGLRGLQLSRPEEHQASRTGAFHADQSQLYSFHQELRRSSEALPSHEQVNKHTKTTNRIVSVRCLATFLIDKEGAFCVRSTVQHV